MTYSSEVAPVQARPPSVAGCSLAPWREWLEEGEHIKERHSRYPVDKRKGT